MKIYQVNFKSIDHVKNFVEYIQHVDSDIDLMRDRYVIDAKSIMGVFSMDLSKPIDMIVHSDEKATLKEVENICNNLGLFA